MDDRQERELVEGARDARALVARAVARSPFAIATVEGPTHIIRSVNRAFCSLADRDEGSLLGRALRDVLPTAQGTTLELLDRVRRTGQPELSAEIAAWPLPGGPAGSERLMVQLTAATDDLREVNQRLVLASVLAQEQAELAERRAADLSARLDAADRDAAPAGSADGDGVAGWAPLTQRERDVAVLVARGLTNRQIARWLGLEAGTVANYVGRVLLRRGLSSRAALAAWVAVDAGRRAHQPPVPRSPAVA
jgi:DNA-binding CsgD family transcriptional regulator